MNVLNRFVLVSALLVPLVVGCSTTYAPQKTSPQPVTTRIDNPTSRQLIAHFRDWEGTPYRMGGQSKKGIDCSGYIQLAYRQVFNTQVPRTTEKLSTTGYPVADNKRRFGDLLVFKTGFIQKHVGIYIGNNQFIHASTSKGVTASRLDNPYWSSKYRQTRRVVD